MVTTTDVMDFSFLTDIFTGFNYGSDLLVLVLVGISAVAITRDTRHMRLLLFPLVFGWSRIGLATPAWLLAGSAIVTVVTLVGVHNIGATLGALQGTITETFRGSGIGKRRAMARAMGSAETDFELEQAMSPFELDKAQYRAEQQLAKNEATYGTRMQSEELTARFRDELDEKTTPLQIGKALRSKKTGRTVGKRDAQEELLHAKWIAVQKAKTAKARKSAMKEFNKATTNQGIKVGSQRQGQLIQMLTQKPATATYNRQTPFGQMFNARQEKGKVAIKKPTYKGRLTNAERISLRQQKQFAGLFNKKYGKGKVSIQAPTYKAKKSKATREAERYGIVRTRVLNEGFYKQPKAKKPYQAKITPSLLRNRRTREPRYWDKQKYDEAMREYFGRGRTIKKPRLKKAGVLRWQRQR